MAIDRVMRVYHYVGSKEIKDSVANYPIGTVIKSPQDVANWINNLSRETDIFGYVVCTFIIDLAGYLLLADRHSEHIACSGGNPVLSAGEIFFVFEDNKYKIAEISNQSTGFCPEPESWFYVSQALDRIYLEHPDGFTTNFMFRRCVQCNLLNVVKQDFFYCVNCNAKLSKF